MKLLYTPLYLALLCLLACNKSKDLPVDPSKLKKATSNNGGLNYQFSYDQQGRLSQMTSNSFLYFKTLEYVYDGDSKRISHCNILEATPLNEAMLNYIRYFSYDDKDRLVSIELKKNTPGAPDLPGIIYGSRYEFQYQQSGDKYSSCIMYCKDQLREFPFQMNKFWYDFKGNISAISYHNYSEGNWHRGYDVIFGYSEVPNPFYRNTDPLDFEKYASKRFWVSTSNNRQLIIGFPVTSRECTMDGLRLESSTDNLRQATYYEYY